MQAAQRDDAFETRPVRIPLSVNDPNAGRSLTRSVERILRDGRGRTPVVVELHGNSLPAPLVAELIGNLRRLREVGGALAVNAGSAGVAQRARAARPGPRARLLAVGARRATRRVRCRRHRVARGRAAGPHDHRGDRRDLVPGKPRLRRSLRPGLQLSGFVNVS